VIFRNDEPCFMGEPVTSVRKLSSGANNVYTVNNRFVYKEFALPELCLTEATALRLMGPTATSTPTVIGNGNQTLTTNYVDGAKEAYEMLLRGDISSQQVNALVSRFMLEQYQLLLKGSITEASALSWKTRLREIVLWWNIVGKTWCAHFPNQLDVLSQGLDVIVGLLPRLESTALVHRDLHMSNLLLTDTRGYLDLTVIDCEHALIGPIELEFLNSRFWNDNKSLDVDAIIRILRTEYMVPFDVELEAHLMPFYIADQLLMAYKLINEDKRDKLLVKASEAFGWQPKAR